MPSLCCGGASDTQPAPKIKTRDFKGAAAAPAEKVDWAKIKGKLLPLAEQTEAAKEARAALFTQMDNGTGTLCLAEVDKGLRDNLELDDIYDAKPAIMRAFAAAKNVSKKPGDDGELVERSEFRLLLVYLYQYFCLWEIFDEIAVADENRFDFAEFQKGLNSMGLAFDDPKAEFDSMASANGHVLFTDFCEWALSKKLDLEDLAQE